MLAFSFDLNNRKLMVYTINTGVHYLFSVFWTVFILYGILKGESLSENIAAFANLLFLVAALDIIFGIFADVLSKKLFLTIGILSFATGGALRIISDHNIFFDLSFYAFAVFIASVNGTLQAWSLNKKDQFFSSIPDSTLHGHLHLCRRISQALNIFTPLLISSYQDAPWVISITISLALLTMIILLSESRADSTGQNLKIKTCHNSTNRFYFIALATIFIGMVFYGLEFGLRNVIIAPFVLFDLNNGVVENIWLQIFVQVIAGISGNIFYNKKIASHQYSKSYYIGLALALYAVADCVSAWTTSYYMWLCFSGLAVFSMGWYFPILDAFITENVAEKYRATALSLKTSVYYLSGAIILKSYFTDITFDNLREWWLYSGYFLFISATAFWAYMAFEKVNLNYEVKNG